MIMKKLFFILASAMLLFACSKEDVAPEMTTNSSENRIFHASFEGTTDPETKVYADEKLRLRWDSEDLITIFERNTANSKYKVTNLSINGNACDFAPVESSQAGATLPNSYAVYPYAENTSISASDPYKIEVLLPNAQEYRENSFGIGANTMVAVADDDDLMFKNVCGYLRFRFYGEGVKVSGVTLEGNNGEKLAGSALITPGENPTVEMVESSAQNSVELICEPAVELGSVSTDSTVFIFAIPPTTFSKGFKVIVRSEDDKVFERIEISNSAIVTTYMQAVPNTFPVFNKKSFIPLTVRKLPIANALIFNNCSSHNNTAPQSLSIL